MLCVQKSPCSNPEASNSNWGVPLFFSVTGQYFNLDRDRSIPDRFIFTIHHSPHHTLLHLTWWHCPKINHELPQNTPTFSTAGTSNCIKRAHTLTSKNYFSGRILVSQLVFWSPSYIWGYVVCDCLHRAKWHSSATLNDVSPCLSLSCKANDRV